MHGHLLHRGHLLLDITGPGCLASRQSHGRASRTNRFKYLGISQHRGTLNAPLNNVILAKPLILPLHCFLMAASRAWRVVVFVFPKAYGVVLGSRGGPASAHDSSTLQALECPQALKRPTALQQGQGPHIFSQTKRVLSRRWRPHRLLLAHVSKSFFSRCGCLRDPLLNSDCTHTPASFLFSLKTRPQICILSGAVNLCF